jgi:hypothetical protein
MKAPNKGKSRGNELTNRLKGLLRNRAQGATHLSHFRRGFGAADLIVQGAKSTPLC